MRLMLVTYDLNRPGQNDEALIEAIEGHGHCCHVQGSTWLVRTWQTPQQVGEALRRRMEAGDSLLVVPVDRHHLYGCLTDAQWRWMIAA